MKQSLFLYARELFPGSDIVRKYTFKAINTRDNCTLLARANHQLSQDFANTRDESTQIRKKDCFECLPPYHIAA